jgi:hypothetical protein
MGIDCAAEHVVSGKFPPSAMVKAEFFRTSSQTADNCL